MCANEKITLAHGSGGQKTGQLIKEIFFKAFENETLIKAGDSAILNSQSEKLCMTTDSFVVQPQSFPGGNIGKLAVCGTVNDLAVAGAVAKYMSVGFILEEGLAINELKRYVNSMAKTAKDAGVLIVTGDTKVVPANQCDKIYINTTGIGFLDPKNQSISEGTNIKDGDCIILSGNMGDHGMAIFASRYPNQVKTKIESDCACLNHVIKGLLKLNCNIKFMRDPTRGGVAGVLNEIAEQKNLGIQINEDQLPINQHLTGLCEILGFDPIYLANEGKFIVVCSPSNEEEILKYLRSCSLSKNAATIGRICKELNSRVVLKTIYGGKRLLEAPISDPLPRIC